ncbi:hypothetical protein [Haladaptatus sp. DYF46]|uniref:WD40/YVTN/BNR-like repeat-containing protein n=1 Tax=Haladaptatus sp. DYF46 TaxID=2886041 RepID=UPI001E31368A|nr:hypothetical protein [Haladaptatus sp. DYF46]
MANSTRSERGFVPFFRRYTKTWIHAVATAGLTAFGTLTFVNRAFAIVAVGIYVLPPVVLYLRGANPDPSPNSNAAPESERFSDDDERDIASGNENAADDSAESEEDGDDSPVPTWTSVETPTEGTLFDTAVAGDAAYAVGEDGIFLRSEGKSDEWDVELEDGPNTSGADLRGVDATADGDAVWVAGDGGALGRFDSTENRHTDRSAPADITDNWTALAVAGTADDETVLLANGSGQVLRGRYRNGEIAWETPFKPGSGSSISAATMADTSVGYLCDTNDGVFETDDGGETFRRVGIDDVNGTLTDVAATGDACYVTTDDGVCYRGGDDPWTPTRLDEGVGIRAVSANEGSVAACGETGAVYERTDGGWDRTVTPASGALRGISVGASRRVAVGEDGTVVQRTDGAE